MSISNDNINTLLFMIENKQIELDVCAFADKFLPSAGSSTARSNSGSGSGSSPAGKRNRANTFSGTPKANNGKAEIVIKKHLNKESASEAEVIFVDVIIPNMKESKLAMALKLWINWSDINEITIDGLSGLSNDEKWMLKESESASLVYESKVYQYITDKFIKRNLSNNFIPFIGLATCNFDHILSALEAHQTEANYASLFKKFNKFKELEDVLKVSLLVTGTLNNPKDLVSLYDLLANRVKDHKLSKNEIKSIVAQILYALFLMQTHKISHNDLHLNNILVEIVPFPGVDVTIEGITFNTNYVPKIYDWDFAYCEALGPNPKHNNYDFAASNLGNRFKKSADYYQFVCGIFDIKHVTSAPFDEIFSALLPNLGYKYWIAPDTKSEIPVALTTEQNASLEKYITNNSSVKLYNNFINIPKKDFDALIPGFDKRAVFKIDSEINKFDNAKNVYFKKENNIIVFKTGHFCSPMFDPSERILYPLEEIFSTESELFYRLFDFVKRSPITFIAPTTFTTTARRTTKRTMMERTSPLRKMLPSKTTRTGRTKSIW